MYTSDSIYDTVVGSKAKWILCDSTEASRCLAVAKRLNFPLEVIVTSQDCIEGCSSIFDYFYDDGLGEEMLTIMYYKLIDQLVLKDS